MKGPFIWFWWTCQPMGFHIGLGIYAVAMTTLALASLDVGNPAMYVISDVFSGISIVWLLGWAAGVSISRWRRDR